MKEKHKILDTNIILNDPESFYAFPHKDQDVRTIVYIPLVVQRELDKFAHESHTERGMHARTFFREIDDLSDKLGKTLYEGIPISENYIVKTTYEYESKLKTTLDGILSDNNDKILLELLKVMEGEGKDVELITLDLPLKTIGQSLSLHVSGWRDLKVKEIYKGWRQVTETDFNVKYLGKLGDSGIKGLEATEFSIKDPQPNEYFILISEKDGKTALARFQKSEKPDQPDLYVPLRGGEIFKKDIRPRNPRQAFFLDALMNPDLECVFGLGPAGTGKTFLGVLAGFVQAIWGSITEEEEGSAINSEYSKLIITRPLIGFGDEEDIGALPGDLFEKLAPWNRPIYDNINQITMRLGIKDVDIDYIISEKLLEILPMQMARGASLQSYYWQVDEAQNLTWRKIKTIGTRIAEGSKLVFTGDPDPEQSDIGINNVHASPLVRASNLFKDDLHSATVYFEQEDCVRSRLVSQFLKRMTAEFIRKNAGLYKEK